MQPAAGKLREHRLTFQKTKGKIHARAVSGRFNTWRWAMVWLTQIVFYGACWLQWPGADGPRQALWLDIAHEKFHLFGLVLWPQDALLAVFALVFAATGLFYVTALSGRLFCGFACPQTIYTMIFTWIEARVEGDHLARMKLDSQPAGPRKLALKLVKHALWAAVAAWTAITFVGYFTPIRELLPAIGAFATGPWESFWLLFYALFTYVQAGLAREAVCQHMCPYSRFQGVMFDPWTKNVAYDAARGEPRRPGRSRKAGTGDCIDCGICVQVCPTGIDIRDGLQYQCINCGLCIDACDQVMARTGMPAGLIRFAPEAAGTPAAAAPGPAARPRLLVYLALLVVSCALAAWTLARRPPFLVDVLRDRGALSREGSDGRIENAYTVKLVNLGDARRDFVIDASGQPGLDVVGERRFSVDAGSIRPVALNLAMPADGGPAGALPIRLHIRSRQAPAGEIVETSRFILPAAAR